MRRAAIPLQALVVDDAELPIYLRIADQAKHLRDLGMSDRAIAGTLGVSDKTVAKAAGQASALDPGNVPSEGFSLIERADLPSARHRARARRG